MSGISIFPQYTKELCIFVVKKREEVISMTTEAVANGPVSVKDKGFASPDGDPWQKPSHSQLGNQEGFQPSIRFKNRVAQFLPFLTVFPGGKV